MRLNELQLNRLSERVGQDVRTPAGATVLSIDIGSRMGHTLSVNTIKRLVGVLPEEVNPTRSTLNILANYLGYPDWDILEEDTAMEGSGFGKSNVFIEMSDLDEDAEVEICWRPGRRILLRHDGCGQYTVLESENSKLRPGDLLSLSQLAIGFPFIADKVFRDENPLGTYRAADGAADGAGITSLNIL